MSDGVLEAALLDYELAFERRRYGDAAAALRTALKCTMDAPERVKLEASLGKIDDFIRRCASGQSPQDSPVRRPSVGPGLDPSNAINAACRELGVTGEDVFACGRHPAVVLARMVIFTLLRRHSHLSYPDIARATGRPNHSTIITGVKRFEAMLTDPNATYELGPRHRVNPTFLLLKLERALGVPPSEPASAVHTLETHGTNPIR